jgi:Tfp pilus assembly protein PilO
MIERLKSLPFALIFVIYLGYLGYQYYQFADAPDGEIETHKAQIVALKNEITGLRGKLVEGQKFLKSVELKKAEIQEEVKKLGTYQGALSEDLNVPSLIKVLFTEAKKSDLKVDRIEPGKKTQKEYYLEQEFNLDVRGTYQNLVLFTQRVSQLQRILRIEAYSLKPIDTGSARYAQVSGKLSVRAYQYSMSKEDQIGKGENK